MAALVVAMHIEVWFTLSIELGPRIDGLVWIINHTAYSMASIITVVASVVARRVLMFMMILCHPLDQSTDNSPTDHSANVMTSVVIHTGIGIKTVAPTMMVSPDISKNSGATLRDPDIFAARIIPPGPVQNAWTS